MGQWDMLQRSAAALNTTKVEELLRDAPEIPPSVVRAVFHNLWRSSRTHGSSADVKKILVLLAEHGVNPLVLNDALEPFSADWNSSLYWINHINRLAHTYKWQTWTQGGLLHSVCVNGAFHLKSVECLLRSPYTLLHKDIQGNTPWHILWKDGQLEHLGYIQVQRNYARLDTIQHLFNRRQSDLYGCNAYGESVKFLIEQRIEQIQRFNPNMHDLTQKMWNQYIRQPLTEEIQQEMQQRETNSGRKKI